MQSPHQLKSCVENDPLTKIVGVLRLQLKSTLAEYETPQQTLDYIAHSEIRTSFT
jgi:hypothetical protein